MKHLPVSKQATVVLGVLAFLAVVAIAPSVYAQGITYTGSDDPHGSLQYIAWGVGLGTAGAAVGFGVIAMRRRH